MRISVVIPTYNEEENIGKLIQDLQRYGGYHLAEIIVADAPSNDQTALRASQAGAKVVVADKPGRASQMNAGAREACGDVLYFVHADVDIHPDFAQDIKQSLENGYQMGCYRYEFDLQKPILKFNAYCTRFDRIWCRGGDQTLFIFKAEFQQLGGYREDHHVMEDYEFILRARRNLRFQIIPKNVVVSARKYEYNSYFRVNLANMTIFAMYFLGVPQPTLICTYKSMIKVEKYGLQLEKQATANN
jgi:rSAM/selenodomain-associated transferase 2